MESGALDVVLHSPLNTMQVENEPTIRYEIQVINKLSHRINIQEIVIKNSQGQILKSLKAENSGSGQIETRFINPSSLNAGERGVIYLEIAFDAKHLPDSIDNIITSKDSASSKIFTDHVKAKIEHPSPLVLAPPLRPGNWVAIYNPDWPRGHRRVVYNKNGIDRIPGRFAIDFMKLDEEGHYAKGDENVINNWYGYGQDVLAVGDGVVSSTRDDFKESKTIADHPTYPADMATGNYISIKIDDGHFVFYEHLKPESIMVKNGQVVRKGQRIAKVGFTGQTTGPHLHLHVADNDSPLGAEGLPFVFGHFDLIGTYHDFSAFGKRRWSDENRKVDHEHPPSNSVIRF